MRAFTTLSCLPLLGILAEPAAFAALADPPHQDVHFLAEHVPEVALDSRGYAMPWPAETLAPKSWEIFAQAGFTSTQADFIKLSGRLAALGGAYAYNESSALVLFGSYDSFSVSGGRGELVLRPLVTGLPLDLPERAEFSNARGDIRHFGVSAAWVHHLAAKTSTAESRWTLQVGLRYDRLELENYAFDFRILDGASAGTVGVLDHSNSADYFTPFFGMQRAIALGRSWALRPYALGGMPLPSGEFDGRLTGTGFDVSNADEKPGKFGDPFAAVGAGLLHRPTGIEIDLGGALFFPLFEGASHPGLDSAFTLNLTWHLR